MSWFRQPRPQAVSNVVQNNIHSITQLEQEFADQRTPLDRVSDAITSFAGSLRFILAHAGIFLLWVVVNTPWVLGRYSFDPYPYVFLNLVLAAEAVFLGTFVLMSQNRQNRQAERRASLDLQIGLLAEQETTKTLQMLSRICDRLGLEEVAHDRELQQMIQTTHVQTLAQELQKANDAGETSAAAEPMAPAGQKPAS
ncbi:MAG: DUF1003 domain-containing protein [Gemmataceae bacterium]|nr:DUF1003 domain-containing protein [Gemmataceae bacterium]